MIIRYFTIVLSLFLSGLSIESRGDNPPVKPARADAPLELNSCPTPVSPNRIVCSPGEISLVATGASATQTYKWYNSQTGGSPIGTGSPFVFNVTESISLFVSISDTNCEGSRDEVVITLTSNPPGPSTTNGSSCGPGQVTMSASSTLPDPVFRWYDRPFDGNLLTTGPSYSVSLTTVSDTFYVQVVSGACSSSRTMTIARLRQIPQAPSINDTTRCGAGSVTLAPGLPPGATAKWYADSLPSTQAFFAGPVFTTPPFSGTIFYFVSTVLFGCESPTREKVFVNFNLGPPLEGANDVARCQPGVYEFTASTSAGSSIHWYDAAEGGNQIASGPTFTTPFLSQDTSFWVAARDAGGCETVRKEVKAVLVEIPEPPLGADTFRCGPGTVAIEVLPTPGFTAQWYSEASGGTPFFSGSVYTTPEFSSEVVYYVSASIPGCESGRRQIKASVRPVPAGLSPDTTDRCDPGQLLLKSGSAADIRWYSDQAGTQFLAAGSDLAVNVSQSTPYYMVIKDNVTTCESPAALHLARINKVNIAASPAEIIAGEVSTLSCDPGASYTWSPAATLSSPSNRVVQAKPVVNTTYTVTVVYESGCSLSDNITVNVTAAEIPNVFTPNGDRIFDTWEIPGALKNPGNKLLVFNRWGNLVKEVSGYKNDWDGGDLPAGTYYYRYEEGSGKPALSGTVTIVK